MSLLQLAAEGTRMKVPAASKQARRRRRRSKNFNDAFCAFRHRLLREKRKIHCAEWFERRKQANEMPFLMPFLLLTSVFFETMNKFSLAMLGEKKCRRLRFAACCFP